MERDRVRIDKQTPKAQKALIAVAVTVKAAGAAAGLSRRTIELINVRVSQITGCAFCLDTHHRAALAAGVTERELAVLPAWRRTELFDDIDRAALALAEVTATLPDEAPLDREYTFARAHLSDDQLSAVVWVATTIGAFNRVSIMSRHPVRAQEEDGTVSESENKVVANAEAHRYEVFHEGKLAGFAEYTERGDVTDFTHTEIDDAFAGKGLGKVLAAGALDDVVARGRVIEAHCPFIRAYLEKNPGYDAHVLGKGVQRP